MHPGTKKPFTPQMVQRMHDEIIWKAGLNHVQFADLRHTFATMAVQRGVDVKTLSSMLEHDAGGLTLDAYHHVTDQMQKAAVQRMQGVMDAALPNEQPDPSQDNACEVITCKKAMNT